MSDSGVTIKLIHMVNAAIHGEPIGSVKHAILLLGLNAIKNIVLSSELLPDTDIRAPISQAVMFLY